MLVRGSGKTEEDGRANKSFKELGGGAEKGDGAVRRREVGRFTRFRDGEDKGMLPDSGEVS